MKVLSQLILIVFMVMVAGHVFSGQSQINKTTTQLSQSR